MIDHRHALSDRARLAALTPYSWDDPALRTELDRIAASTAAALDQPVSLITLVLDSAQELIGSHGVSGWVASAGGTPVEWSFCATTVVTGAPYVVDDAAAHPDHHDNPLVAIDGMAAYAGVPLRTPDGQVLGGHCVISGVPHHWTSDEVAALQAAADEVTTVLNRYRTAS
ncbi:MAG: GAF domain-containing protein [Kineosporiaceae bacterium]